MILQQMKDELIRARKESNKNAITLLSTVIGEIENKLFNAKNKTEDEVSIEVVRYFVKNLHETHKLAPSREAEFAILFYSRFLPRPLTEEEVKEAIDKLEDKSIPNIMKTLKAQLGIRFEGKLVQQVAKSL